MTDRSQWRFDGARLAAGELPILRSGQEVVHIYDSGLNTMYPIVAWLRKADGSIGGFCSYTADGRGYANSTAKHENDLVYPPKMRKVRVALYMCGTHTCSFTDCDPFHDSDFLFNTRVECRAEAGTLVDVVTVEVPE